MRHPWIEISQRAFYHNVAQIKKIVGITSLGIVAKAHAYGHGLFHIAHLGQQHPDITYFFTAASSEALILRDYGITKPILALAYRDTSFHDIINNNIEITLYDIAQITEFHAAVRRFQKPLRIHIKIDTGMSRLGIMPNDVVACLEKIRSCGGVIVQGIFTHLADTNDPEQLFTHYQLTQFDMLAKKIIQAGISIPFIHVLASGSLIEPQRYSMVRVGTSIYGYHKSKSQYERFRASYPDYQLQQIMTVKAPLITHYNEEGSKKYALCSYGHKDGLQLKPGMKVIMNDMLAPIVKIDQEYSLIDISCVPEKLIQDWVTIVGSHPQVSIENHAHICQTIGNDLVTSLSPVLSRYIIP